MYKLVVADINADVRERVAHGVEEHQVARTQFSRLDAGANAAHFNSAARQQKTERVVEDIADEAAAVEARFRRIAAKR